MDFKALCTCSPRRRRCLSSCGFGIMFVCIVIVCISGIAEAAFPSISGTGDILHDVPKLPDVPRISNPVNLVFQNKCIEDLGCFYNGPPFYHPLHRPLSKTPTSNLDTKFALYTPTNREDKEMIEATENSIARSSFNPRLPIKVIIHGYKSDLEEGDIRFQIKDALLKTSDFNVIIVDWTKNNGPSYPQAVANARAVGAQVAKLLNFLIKTRGVKPQDIHVIGHSLGGQMSGWIGERIPNLGRITGLDPAGPYFQEAERLVRLDPTDAIFVDVIHSNGGECILEGLGIAEPVGHMDFYPNGGCKQPGCAYKSSSDSIIGAAVNLTTKYMSYGCDHGRANHYFLESIDNSACRFRAIRCKKYGDFEKGICRPQKSIHSEMGYHAKKMPGVPINSQFFLRTSGARPFCIEDSIYV